MKTPVWILLALSSAPAFAFTPMPLTHELPCILQAVAAEMNVTLKKEIPLPALYLESQTPIKQFQDAVEPQWGYRPGVFLNAYILARNEIFLSDDLQRFSKHGRFVDDSLAHELAHYVQVKYQKADFTQDYGDFLEIQAVQVQNAFREKFMKTGLSPCGK